MNLNGDYISDALAAQVGGIGIAPGANINYLTGHAIFEATHGTAPKYAGQDKVNPGSVILSGEMMFRHLGWHEAADLIIRSLEKTIAPEAGDLRLRAADDRRDAAQDQRVRRGDGREHVGRRTEGRNGQTKGCAAVTAHCSTGRTVRPSCLPPFRLVRLTVLPSYRLPFNRSISRRSLLVGRPFSGAKAACSDLS